MKKLVLAALAVAVMASASFASSGADLNLKLGLQAAGNLNSADYSAMLNRQGFNTGNNIGTNLGLGFAAEFLFPVSNEVKIGPALGIEFARDLDLDFVSGAGISFSFIPIYVTIEISPISSIKELFLKGNFGYNVATETGYNQLISISNSFGGLYYGIGAGYNFPNGFVIDVLYSWNKWSDDFDGKATYSKLGIEIGYKIAL
ncbi:outer membrane beta-barrel protein [Endomicrobium proavitum]|uniref:Outer membrane protein beta-barrel domain-containing protein n=1 Tax=Endomicrobium proavitum TaxID=1408281 RepID=A0A0G3WKY1_9BACT|nr:outer membrane beta-barrel protein [Endomicrobium proavitum]AKL98512.1 exported protein of unknown function [Endomicrobium proavitum]